MIKTGLEIVNLHKDYEVKVKELEHSMETVHDYSYSKNVLLVEMEKLQRELRILEDTRFQPMDPVVVRKSTLGGIVTSPE